MLGKIRKKRRIGKANQIRTLEIGLRLEGFHVCTAREAEGALALLQFQPVDIAIVDLMMPGINGIELARKIRDQCPETRVVLTSAYHLSATQLTRGVGGFVPKPYVLSELYVFLRAKLAQTSPSGAHPTLQALKSEARLRAS